jgi:hypothetical protein
VLCAPGYSLSDDESCCVRTEGSPLDYPVCPVGGDFDPDSNICWFRLPSTGDEKCDSATVFFDSCEQEEEDEPGGGGDGPVCHLNLVGPECEAAGGTPSICSGIVVGTYPCCICD